LRTSYLLQSYPGQRARQAKNRGVVSCIGPMPCVMVDPFVCCWCECAGATGWWDAPGCSHNELCHVRLLSGAAAPGTASPEHLRHPAGVLTKKTPLLAPAAGCISSSVVDDRARAAHSVGDTQPLRSCEHYDGQH
jgi:hypothetical protein